MENFKNAITAQRRLNDYGFACINGYKGSIYDYLQFNYKGYCELCARVDVKPMSYDEWRSK